MTQDVKSNSHSFSLVRVLNNSLVAIYRETLHAIISFNVHMHIPPNRNIGGEELDLFTVSLAAVLVIAGTIVTVGPL